MILQERLFVQFACIFVNKFLFCQFDRKVIFYTIPTDEFLAARQRPN